MKISTLLVTIATPSSFAQVSQAQSRLLCDQENGVANLDQMFEWLKESAKTMALSTVFDRPPRKEPCREFDYGPPDSIGMTYHEEIAVTCKQPVVENEGTGYIASPRKGTAWEQMRIFYQPNNQTGTNFVEYKYDEDLVHYDSFVIQPPLPRPVPECARHWTEVSIFSLPSRGLPRLINMRANGYSRLASGQSIYGFSERAFLDQEGLDNREGTQGSLPEVFPLLTHVYFSFPQDHKSLIYQVYESEHGVMVRRLHISFQAEETTVLNVTGIVYQRQGVSFTTRQNIGMGFSSMYWKGAREGAPPGTHAHDSDTVSVTYLDGYSQDFPIPSSPEGHQGPIFVNLDQDGTRPIEGYALEQRDRNPANYMGSVDYHLRSSVQITNICWSVPTTTQLIVLPDWGEYFDNVVLRTVIRPPVNTDKSTEPIHFSYTMTVGLL